MLRISHLLLDESYFYTITDPSILGAERDEECD